MNTRPSRKVIADACLNKKIFQLRIPSSGIILRPVYQFNQNRLLVGQYIGAIDESLQSWIDIGQITFAVCLSDYYHINTMARLTENNKKTLPHGMCIKVPSKNIVCVFQAIRT